MLEKFLLQRWRTYLNVIFKFINFQIRKLKKPVESSEKSPTDAEDDYFHGLKSLAY